MGLVDYGSSSSSASESEPAAPSPVSGKKRKRSPRAAASSHEAPLPRLPPAFHDLYATNPRVSTHDDPSLHGGRKRIAPHQAGNWPTHVYLEWFPSSEEFLALQQILCEVKTKFSTDSLLRGLEITSSLTDEAGAPRPLHISLSQPLLLHTGAKEAFLKQVRDFVHLLCTHGQGNAAVRPFHLSFKDLIWAANAERTRWFLALRLARPAGDQLNKLLAACNQAVTLQGFSRLYAKPRTNDASDLENPEDLTEHFHFSLAWALRPPIPTDDRITVVDLKSEALERVMSLAVPVDAVKVKIGNTVSSLALSSHSNDYRGVLG